jgi:hypothetical protein
MPFDGIDLSEAAKALMLLEMAEAYFQGGKYWIKGRYRHDDRRCIIGALDDAVEITGFPKLGAWHYLLRAIDPRYASILRSEPLFWRGRITRFNDTEVTSYRAIRKAFTLARHYAEQELAQTKPAH